MEDQHLPHEIYSMIFMDMIPAWVRRQMRKQDKAAKCIQQRFRRWMNERVGCFPVCTDRHGFILKPGDVVGDYSHPGLQFVVKDIDLIDDVCPPYFMLIGAITNGQRVDEYDESGEEGDEHVCDAWTCFAIEQGERASFCEVCDTHFEKEHVTWWWDGAVPFMCYGRARNVHSACPACAYKRIQ